MNRDGLYTCTLCGLTDGPVYDYNESSNYMHQGKSFLSLRGFAGCGGGNGKRKRGSELPERYPGCTYNSKYHTNERLAQVLLTGPRVPHPILFIIKLEYFSHPGKYPSIKNLTKRDISLICRNTKVPPFFRKEYQSKKDKFNLFESCTIYAERWYYLKMSLGGCLGTVPTTQEERRLKWACGEAQNKWNMVRHKPECTQPGIICHKLFKCRKNFPNLYYVMAQLCILFGYTHLLHLFPVNNQAKTLKELNIFWEKICHQLGWKYIGWNERIKYKP